MTGKGPRRHGPGALGSGYFLLRAHEGQSFAQLHWPPLSHAHLSLPQAEHFMMGLLYPFCTARTEASRIGAK